MNLRELLTEMRALQVYDPGEWEEYIGYFDGCGDLAALSSESELLERIRRRMGAGHARLDPSASPKIVTADPLRGRRAGSAMTLGVVSGAYGLPHLGHIRSMVRATALIDRVLHRAQAPEQSNESC